MMRQFGTSPLCSYRPGLRDLICDTPDLLAKIWPAQRVLIGLRVSWELRQALGESCNKVVYSAREGCLLDELKRADFTSPFQNNSYVRAEIILRHLRGNTVRWRCAFETANFENACTCAYTKFVCVRAQACICLIILFRATYKYTRKQN